MNDYMKNILSKFFLTSAILMSLTLLITGSVSVSQASQRSIDGQDFAIVAAKSQNEKLEISVDEKVFEFDFEGLQKLKSYEKYVDLTPISSLYNFVKAIQFAF